MWKQVKCALLLLQVLIFSDLVGLGVCQSGPAVQAFQHFEYIKALSKAYASSKLSECDRNTLESQLFSLYYVLCSPKARMCNTDCQAMIDSIGADCFLQLGEAETFLANTFSKNLNEGTIAWNETDTSIVAAYASYQASEYKSPQELFPLGNTGDKAENLKETYRFIYEDLKGSEEDYAKLVESCESS